MKCNVSGGRARAHGYYVDLYCEREAGHKGKHRCAPYGVVCTWKFSVPVVENLDGTFNKTAVNATLDKLFEDLFRRQRPAEATGSDSCSRCGRYQPRAAMFEGEADVFICKDYLGCDERVRRQRVREEEQRTGVQTRWRRFVKWIFG